MAKRDKKKETPAWVDRLLSFRKEITEDEYRTYWKRLNKVRKNREDWNREGQKIISELEGVKEQSVFRVSDYGSVRQAKRAAEIFRNDNGGRILRRNSSGRFSRTGRTFQVIGAKK